MKQSNLGIGSNNTIPYKKIDNIPWTTIQTKKKSFVTGGGWPIKITKKKYKQAWYNPKGLSFNSGLQKSTKKLYQLSRFAASTQTKKKREIRGQQRDESHVQKKLYDYNRLKDSVTAYQTAKDELKRAKDKGSSKEVIADFKKKKEKAKALMYDLGNIKTYMSPKDILKMAESGIAKYEEKQKYYVESTDKLKGDSIDFIKNRTEYIKNGKPELTKKLDSLATSDHTKMAFIKISGRGPVPVNKLKYSDFNIDNPRVTNAYLDQFKTVNDSITKINKDFNITRLSPERRVELAHELHKITVDGIHDPVAQEHHFLKAVTDISYKDKYYSALSQDGKRDNVLKSYMEKQVPYAQPEDTPMPNLRQKKTALEQKLRRTDSLSDVEKNNIRTEIEYLDKELKQSPETIDKQIHEQEKLMTGISKLDPKYNEMRMNLDRLKEHRANIETVQKADFASDTTIIANEIARLKEARGLLLKTTKMDTTTDTDVDSLRNKLSEMNEQLGESDTNAEIMTDEKRKGIELKKAKLESKIKKQEAIIQKQKEFTQMQDAIATLESMTPEAREKFKDELQGKSSADLKDLLSKKQQIQQLGDNPMLRNVLQKDIAQIESALKVQDFKQQINANQNMLDMQKDLIKRQITSVMSQNNVNALKTKIRDNKELNFRLAKQLADEKATFVAKQRVNAKEKLIDAKTKRKKELNSIWKRVGAKFIMAPENIQVLRRLLKADTNYSKNVAQKAAKISKAVEAGKITPEKAAKLLKQFETKHVGYIPDDSLKLLAFVKNTTQQPAQKTNYLGNPVVYARASQEGNPIAPVKYDLASPGNPTTPVKYDYASQEGNLIAPIVYANARNIRPKETEIYANVGKKSPYGSPYDAISKV